MDGLWWLELNFPNKSWSEYVGFWELASWFAVNANTAGDSTSLQKYLNNLTRKIEVNAQRVRINIILLLVCYHIRLIIYYFPGDSVLFKMEFHAQKWNITIYTSFRGPSPSFENIRWNFEFTSNREYTCVADTQIPRLCMLFCVFMHSLCFA